MNAKVEWLNGAGDVGVGGASGEGDGRVGSNTRRFVIAAWGVNNKLLGQWGHDVIIPSGEKIFPGYAAYKNWPKAKAMGAVRVCEADIESAYGEISYGLFSSDSKTLKSAGAKFICYDGKNYWQQGQTAAQGIQCPAGQVWDNAQKKCVLDVPDAEVMYGQHVRRVPSARGVAPQLSPFTPSFNFNTSFLRPQVVAGVGQVEWLGEGGDGMLGAPPSIIKKWFPERTDSEWDNLDQADQSTLLNQANTVEAQWNGKINEIRYNGGCDATKPGLLAGAMREHLIKSGGKLADMDDLGEKSFGPKDCAEWRRVFGKAPDQETVAKAVGLVTGSTSIWVKNSANGYTRQITLSSVCPSGFKLPSCPPPAGPPPIEPECSPTKVCPAGQICVDGKCVPGGGGGGSGGGGSSSSSPWGIVLLVGATIGAIYLAMSGVGSKTADNPHCPNCY